MARKKIDLSGGIIKAGTRVNSEYSLTARDQIVYNGALIDAIAAAKTSFLIVDAIYDNSGTAASVLGTASYSVDDVVIAFDTVGSFTEKNIYKCTAAGALGVATFVVRPLTEGLTISIKVELAHPTVVNKIYIANVAYRWDADGTNWLVDPTAFLQPGGLSGYPFTISHTNNGSAVFIVNVPANSQIVDISLNFPEAFNGTAGQLTIGTAADNDLISEATDFLALQTYQVKESTLVEPIDQVTFAPIVIANRVSVNAYLTGLTGASAGVIRGILRILKL